MRTRKIIRLKGYDYSQKGYYFVTIEPYDRKYPFCEIKDGKIILNEIGKIINDRWKWIFDQYDHILMDEYIIMPDHFHGIIRILSDSKSNDEKRSLHDPQLNGSGEILLDPQLNGKKRSLPDSQLNGKKRSLPDSQLNVRATLESPSRPRAGLDPPVHLDRNHSKKIGLSQIIGAFKSKSSKLIHEAGYKDFKWKRSFNDRIIREDELEIKRRYIRNNPIKWNR